MRRMNVNLTEQQTQHLEVEAQRRHTSTSALIREACDHWLARHAALSAIEGPAATWKYLRPLGGGSFAIEDSAGNLVTGANGAMMVLFGRTSGSAGIRACSRCGERFDAMAGTLQGDGVFVCADCRAYLRAQTLEWLNDEEDAEDIAFLQERAGEAAIPWDEVKARLGLTAKL